MGMARILDALAEDKDVITYRPRLREITKSALGAILFQQIIHRAKNNKWKPFYKFAAPCEHRDYVKGDSWQEELGFTERELESARDDIALKIKHGMKRNEIEDAALVFYWTDGSRKTWYEVNQSLVESLLDELYSGDAKGQIALYHIKHKSRFTRKGTKRALYNTETTETTETVDAPPSQEIISDRQEPIVCTPYANGQDNASNDKPPESEQTKAAKAEIMKHLAASQCGQGAGVSDPRQARKEYRKRIGDAFAAVFRHTGASESDKGAAGKLFDLHFPEQRALEFLLHATNGGGERYRTARMKNGDGLNAYHVVNDMDDWRKASYPALNKAQATADRDRAAVQMMMQRE